MSTRRAFLASAAAFAASSPSVLRLARAAEIPGVTGSEIRVGQTAPYSGPASAYGAIGRATSAYIRMVNDNGGVYGRKINFISLDDGYSPPRTVEQTRRLVEAEGVAFLHASVGTATNLAVREYLNDAKIPQLFIESGADLFNDPVHYPWSVPGLFQYRTDGKILAKHILASRPNPRIGVLYQNDDFGRDYLKGVEDVLGAGRAATLVKAVSYETTDPTVDSQIIALQSSGANTLLIAATPKAAAQALRKAYDSGWSPARYMSYVSASLPAVLRPAGLDKSIGVITTATFKDPSDPAWKTDPGVLGYKAFMDKYMPGVAYAENFATAGVHFGQALVHFLALCGDELSRGSLLKQATSFNFQSSLALPATPINISPGDYTPLHQARLQSFDGESWRLFGDILSG